jgi:hypothetical protein
MFFSEQEVICLVMSLFYVVYVRHDAKCYNMDDLYFLFKIFCKILL